MLDPTVLDCDYTIERGGEAVDDAALDLRLEDRGVDHVPGIERGDDPPHFYPVFVLYRSLDDLRAQAAISLDERDAAREALRRRLVPPRRFCRRVEHGKPHRILAQQPPSVLIGVLARGMRYLVDKALAKKAVLRMIEIISFTVARGQPAKRDSDRDCSPSAAGPPFADQDFRLVKE